MLDGVTPIRSSTVPLRSIFVELVIDDGTTRYIHLTKVLSADFAEPRLHRIERCECYGDVTFAVAIRFGRRSHGMRLGDERARRFESHRDADALALLLDRAVAIAESVLVTFSVRRIRKAWRLVLCTSRPSIHVRE